MEFMFCMSITLWPIRRSEGSGSVNKHLTDKFSIQLNLYKIKMTTALPTHFGWNSSFYFLDFWHVDIRIPSITGGWTCVTLHSCQKQMALWYISMTWDGSPQALHVSGCFVQQHNIAYLVINYFKAKNKNTPQQQQNTVKLVETKYWPHLLLSFSLNASVKVLILKSTWRFFKLIWIRMKFYKHTFLHCNSLD